MDYSKIPSDRIWSRVGYSRAVRIGDIIEVAGTSASGPNGQVIAPGDMYEQAKYCIQVICDAIEQLGGKVEHVIRTRVFVTDISLWERVSSKSGEGFSNRGGLIVNIGGRARAR
ncbi:MAG TPA: Rid family hydrolase [Acidimicrobiia bacterium]|nr:Rid family hydrolase [Acidimicrobiia bacterium]